LEEAVLLREAGIKKPIILLEGVFDHREYEVAARLHLQPVVHDIAQIQWLEKAVVDHQLPIWIKLNTGMNRLGFDVDRTREVWQRVKQCGHVGDIRWITHLARADEKQNQFNRRQIDRFTDAIKPFPGQTSIANSAGVLFWPQSHAQWVRPGIMLYGVTPDSHSQGDTEGLQPVMTLTSQLIAVHRLKKGQSIGYGGTWICPMDMPVGVAAMGYGDGYPRHAPSGTPVLVNGKRCDIVGRVSMDMLCIDLRSAASARIGDTVTLWGQGLAVEEIARHAGTIGYELMCSVTARVHKDIV